MNGPGTLENVPGSAGEAGTLPEQRPGPQANPSVLGVWPHPVESVECQSEKEGQTLWQELDHPEGGKAEQSQESLRAPDHYPSSQKRGDRAVWAP